MYPRAEDICSAQWLLLWTTAAYSPETPGKDPLIYIYIYTYLCVYISLSLSLYIYIYVYIHMCVYIYIHNTIR